jgi:phenol 2-monooxygenase
MYLIPRERKIVRFYVQLDEVKLNERGRVDRSKVTPEIIVEGARKILALYNLSYKHCEWFTAYRIGRRMGDSYGKFNRVFLAGDAVHTHSPRGGQGMNLSIHDTYNLGWKIGLCVKNMAPRSILETYESERRQVAQDLIDFDRLVGDPVSGKRSSNNESIEKIDPNRLGMLSAAFYSGFTVNYDKSILVVKDKEERKGVVWTKDVTNRIEVGMRLPSLQILRQADASVWQFLQWLKSDGRFRIILFAGDIKNPTQKERIQLFCDTLEKNDSFLKRVTPPAAKIDSVIEILTLHSSPRTETNIFDFPSCLRPFDEDVGWDYDKIFVDDAIYHYGHGQAYKQYGVDPQKGAVVVVRPDQYVAYTGEIEDVESLERYFADVLLDAS